MSYSAHISQIMYSRQLKTTSVSVLFNHHKALSKGSKLQAATYSGCVQFFSAKIKPSIGLLSFSLSHCLQATVVSKDEKKQNTVYYIFFLQAVAVLATSVDRTCSIEPLPDAFSAVVPILSAFSQGGGGGDAGLVNRT